MTHNTEFITEQQRNGTKFDSKNILFHATTKCQSNNIFFDVMERRAVHANPIKCCVALQSNFSSLEQNQQRNISPVNRMTCRSLLWPTAHTVWSAAKKVLFSRMHVFFASFFISFSAHERSERNTLADERSNVGQLVAFSWAVWDSQSQQSAKQHIAAPNTIAIPVALVCILID